MGAAFCPCRWLKLFSFNFGLQTTHQLFRPCIQWNLLPCGTKLSPDPGWHHVVLNCLKNISGKYTYDQNTSIWVLHLHIYNTQCQAMPITMFSYCMNEKYNMKKINTISSKCLNIDKFQLQDRAFVIWWYDYVRCVTVNHSNITQYSNIGSRIYTLRPNQNSHHFPYDIFKCIFLLKMFEFQLLFHLIKFLIVQLNMSKHWLR